MTAAYRKDIAVGFPDILYLIAGIVEVWRLLGG
jgi:hypothetical protein